MIFTATGHPCHSALYTSPKDPFPITSFDRSSSLKGTCSPTSISTPRFACVLSGSSARPGHPDVICPCLLYQTGYVCCYSISQTQELQTLLQSAWNFATTDPYLSDQRFPEREGGGGGGGGEASCSYFCHVFVIQCEAMRPYLKSLHSDVGPLGMEAMVVQVLIRHVALQLIFNSSMHNLQILPDEDPKHVMA